MTADIIGFTVEAVPPAFAHLGTRKVVAWSASPFGPNALVRAWVGDQPVTAITVDQFGLAFEGFVADPPDPADTLKVEIEGGDKIDTGLKAEDDGAIA